MRNPKRETKHDELMICPFCGKHGATRKAVSQAFGSGRDLVVVEKVPTIFCSHCGEVYFDGETLTELDRILLNKQTLARARRVRVAEFV